MVVADDTILLVQAQTGGEEVDVTQGAHITNIATITAIAATMGIQIIEEALEVVNSRSCGDGDGGSDSLTVTTSLTSGGDDLDRTVRAGHQLHLCSSHHSDDDDEEDEGEDGRQRREDERRDDRYSSRRRNPYSKSTTTPTGADAMDDSSRGGKRRVVRFAPFDTHGCVVSTPTGKVAKNLPWTDIFGITGRYTGRVDDDKMEPHGPGVLIYRDRCPRIAAWENGIPVRAWEPWTENPKEEEERSFISDITSSIASANSGRRNYKSFLPHVTLGDMPALQDMVLESKTAAKVGATLRLHDFAWILRSDYRWTYAIVAERSDTALRFVVDTVGSTKSYSRKYWGRSIRLVAATPRKLSSIHEAPALPIMVRRPGTLRAVQEEFALSSSSFNAACSQWANEYERAIKKRPGNFHVEEEPDEPLLPLLPELPHKEEEERRPSIDSVLSLFE